MYKLRTLELEIDPDWPCGYGMEQNEKKKKLGNVLENQEEERGAGRKNVGNRDPPLKISIFRFYLRSTALF